MKVVYARQTAVVGAVTVVAESHWPANDPVVLAHPALFTDDPRCGLSYSVPPVDDQWPVVEQATKAPGEKRATRAK